MLDRCPQCQYSFEGLPAEGRCPECGLRYDRESIAWRPRFGRTWVIFLSFGLLVLMAHVLLILHGYSRGPLLLTLANVAIASLLFRLAAQQYWLVRRSMLVVAVMTDGVFIRSATRGPRLFPWPTITRISRNQTGEGYQLDLLNGKPVSIGFWAISAAIPIPLIELARERVRQAHGVYDSADAVTIPQA